MTDSDQPLGREATDRSRPRLPLVSVIIVNYNYGRFLDQAIASVFAQTYPRVECIVVDNGSTDGSHDVIASNASRHPDLICLQRASNDGQTIASLDGLQRSQGLFVIFLDADDYLLPRCIQTHMEVHLSTRVHVGVTCGDMLQIVDDQIVISTNEAMANYVRDASHRTNDLLRPTRAALADLWATYDDSLTTRVHLVDRAQEAWVWSPTSGNCFRRDALDLLRDAPGLTQLRSQTDLYLALGINAISGSILVDEPLFAYRIHGANAFSHGAQLQGMLPFAFSRGAEMAGIGRRLLIAHFIANADRFVQDRWQAKGLLRALRSLDVDDPTYEGARFGRRSYLAQMLVRHAPRAMRVLGRGRALIAMLRAGVPLPLLFRLARDRSIDDSYVSSDARPPGG